jgi:hypothetical protein
VIDPAGDDKEQKGERGQFIPTKAIRHVSGKLDDEDHAAMQMHLDGYDPLEFEAELAHSFRAARREPFPHA